MTLSGPRNLHSPLMVKIIHNTNINKHDREKSGHKNKDHEYKIKLFLKSLSKIYGFFIYFV